MLRKRKRRKSTFLPERSERGSVEREYEERRKGLVLLTRRENGFGFSAPVIPAAPSAAEFMAV
jgi:hypothetical protein